MTSESRAIHSGHSSDSGLGLGTVVWHCPSLAMCSTEGALCSTQRDVSSKGLDAALVNAAREAAGH